MLTKIKNEFDNTFIKNSYYFILNSIIGSIFSFIFWIIATNYYFIDIIGLTVAVISSVGIVTIISRLGLEISVIRYFSEDKIKRRLLINTCFSVIVLATLLISLIYLFGLEIWGNKLQFLTEGWILIIIFVIFCLNSAISSIINNILLATRQVKYSLFQTIIFSLLRIVLLLLFSIYFPFFGILIAWLIAECISLVYAFTILIKIEPGYLPYPQFNSEIIREIFPFSVGNYIVNVLSGVSIPIISLMILEYFSPKQNAYFYIAYSIVSMLYTIPQAFASNLLAEGSLDHDSVKINLFKTFKYSYSVLIVLILLIIIFGKNVLSLFGQEYINSYYLLVILSTASIFLTVNQTYISYLRLFLKVKEIIIFVSSKEISFVLMSFILLKYFLVSIEYIGLIYLIINAFFSLYSAFSLKKLNLGDYSIRST